MLGSADPAPPPPGQPPPPPPPECGTRVGGSRCMARCGGPLRGAYLSLMPVSTFFDNLWCPWGTRGIGTSRKIGRSARQKFSMFPVGQSGCNKIYQRDLRERGRRCGKMGKMGNLSQTVPFLSVCSSIFFEFHSFSLHFPPGILRNISHFSTFAPVCSIFPHFPPFPPIFLHFSPIFPPPFHFSHSSSPPRPVG